MIEKMKRLVRENSTCVLATALDNRPHCSLMSYAVDPLCTTIYMVTHKETKKYRNLQQNPNVSLLIDTRAKDRPAESLPVMALTVTGILKSPMDSEEGVLARGLLLDRHPPLREFLQDTGAEIFAVTIRSFQLLEGIKDASFFSVQDAP